MKKNHYEGCSIKLEPYNDKNHKRVIIETNCKSRTLVLNQARNILMREIVQFRGIDAGNK